MSENATFMQGLKEKMAEKYQLMLKVTGREGYGFPHTEVIKDEDGKEIKACRLDGRFVPPFGEKYFTSIQDCAVRDDDVYLCGYPKTGCHWTWEVLKMIQSRCATLSEQGKVQCFMEMVGLDIVDKVPSPRVLNTHVWYDRLPRQLITDKKAKIVLTVRNSKDTAVSFYKHATNTMEYSGTFKAFFELYMAGQIGYGGYADYYNSWYEAMRENPDQPIFIANFENMKEDLPREIRAMAKFLGVELNEDLVLDIAKAAGFDNMKKSYDKTVSQVLLRKGQVGDWKNWLTVSQSERVDDVIDSALRHTCFRCRYTL